MTAAPAVVEGCLRRTTNLRSARPPAWNTYGLQISPAEAEVLKRIGRGLSNKQTAADLCLSKKTVEHHRQSIYDKLDVRDTASMAHLALYLGLIGPKTFPGVALKEPVIDYQI